MALIVKELVVRATLAPESGGEGAETPAPKETGAGGGADISECIDQVMEILARKEER